MSWQLPQKLSDLSVTKQWPQSLREWNLDQVYMHQVGSHCLCSHPIREVCVIRNSKNGNVTQVGNCCIKFFGEHSANFKGMHTVAHCLKRIKQNSASAPNAALITQAAKANVLSSWEVKFAKDTMRKRALTEKQLAVAQRINQKLLACNATPAVALAATPQASLEQLKVNPRVEAHKELVDKAVDQKIINVKDATFLRNIRGKPHPALTVPQQGYKLSLHRKITAKVILP